MTEHKRKTCLRADADSYQSGPDIRSEENIDPLRLCVSGARGPGAEMRVM